MVEANARTAIEYSGIQAEIEKVTDWNEIKKWNILATPGLVINNQVVCAGRIPEIEEISSWLTAAK